MGRDTLRKWDAPSRALFLRRRWFERNINPPGPGVVRHQEDGIERFEENGIIRVTENG